MSQRYHYLDRCRVLLMLLGIPYHAAIMFSRDWGPPQGVRSSFCALFAQTLTMFRMPAFFVIAGFFAAMMLARTATGDWMRNRLIRLGVPLVTATLVLLPLQMLINDTYLGGSIADVMIRFTWHLTHWSSLWISHLWFLHDLIVYSVGIAVLWRLVGGRDAFPWPRLLIVSPFLVLFIFIGVVVALPLALASSILSSGAVPGGWILDRLIHGGIFFLLGVFFSLRRDVLDRWLEWNGFQAMIAGLTIALAVTFAQLGMTRYAQCASPAAAIAGTWLVFASMRRWGDTPNPHVTFLAEASLPIYLVHHPIVQALGMVTAVTTLPPEVEWLGVTMMTFGISTTFYLLIKRSHLLLLLFAGCQVATKDTNKRHVVPNVAQI